MKRIPIYPAGPLGFSEAGRYFHTKIFLPMLVEIGFDPRDPWQLTDQALIDPVLAMPFGEEKRQAWIKLNRIIARNNVDAIRECPICVANLDGVDVDSGTAGEVGLSFGLGKVIEGYRGDFRLSADNIGSTVNLQIEYFIRQSGGEISETIDQLRARLLLQHLRLTTTT